MKPHTRFSRWRPAQGSWKALGLTGVLALGAVAVGSVTALDAAAQTAATASDDHGATLMAQQVERVRQLVPQSAYAGERQRGVDAVLWQYSNLADNALNAARTRLGERLYFEKRLSRDGTVACATCHDTHRGFADARAASEGIGGKVGRRNAPTTLNAVFFETQFWDGRAATLEEQAKLPITNPIEMGQPNAEAAVKAIAGDPTYQQEFQTAYGRGVNFDDIGRAIAAFERTLVFLDSPFDDFLAGNVTAISDDAKAGWALFNGKGRCSTCHHFGATNPIGTNNRFHNIGVSARDQDFEALAKKALELLAKDASPDALDHLALESDLSELGRFVVTRNRADIGAFKTQQVRNVGITAPYMHNGTLPTLWDVVDHYNKGGEANPFLDGGIEALNLSDREVDQLVAFLFSLTDKRFSAQNEAERQRQAGIAAQNRPFRDADLAARKRLPFETRLK